MDKYIITILAPPGGGKGTQGKLLKDKLGAHYLASGDLIRKIKQEPSKLGKKVKEKYDNGIPQPDGVITEVFKRKVRNIINKDKNRKFVFDSFPLSIGQTKSLQKFSNELNIPNVWLVYLDVSSKSIEDRISKRKFCYSCGVSFLPSSINYNKSICNKCKGKIGIRDDDRPKVVKKRISEYIDRVKDVKSFYNKTNRLLIVNGEPSIRIVQNKIIKKLIQAGVIND